MELNEVVYHREKRKLASIQQIKNVIHHPNADKLDIVTVLGWDVICRRDEFQKGELCVYFEIDSILPKLLCFDFIEKRDVNRVIRTAKLRGEISQGLCWPLDILPNDMKIECGMDVTDILGVKKYDAEKYASGDLQPFPSHILQTDEVRIQSFPDVVKELQGKYVAITTKIDGVSSCFSLKNNIYSVCCHENAVADSDNIYWNVSRKFRLKEILTYAGNYSIYAEIAGPKIQKNRLGLEEPELFIFRIYDNDKKRELPIQEVIEFCDKYSLQHVPAELNILFDFTIPQLIEMSDGVYQPSGFRREGIVIVPMEPCYSDTLHGRLSIKVINNKYLLKTGT